MNILRRISNWYFTKSALPYWFILGMDCASVLVSMLLIYFLRFDLAYLSVNKWPLLCGILVAVLIHVLMFRLFHTYRGVLRFSSFIDLIRISLAMLSSALIVLALDIPGLFCPYVCDYIQLPDIQSCVFILLMGTTMIWGLRILVKTLYDKFRCTDFSKGVFVYGCMTGGVSLAKSLRGSGKYSLEGFITGDEALEGSWLLGVRVYIDTDDVVEIMKERGASVLLVSPAQTDRFLSRPTLIDTLIKSEIRIFMMPQAEEWDGKSDLSHTLLREVEIEDLLPRQKIDVDMDSIAAMLRGRRVLITGAAGSIGSEMSRQVAKFAPETLVLIDQAETPMHDLRLYMSKNHPSLNILTIVGSITNVEQMDQIFDKYRPEYVFHAAAYKHVPMMEDNPSMAVQNNVYGTRVIADLAVKYGTKKFVMISTDKAVNPTNVMGCSKRICEIYCQSLNSEQAKVNGTQFITTRFGNVLGSNGSVIPIFREQIRKGGPVTVTHPDIIRFFMLIPEACRLVLEAGTMGKGGEIFVFDMGEPVRIADLAQRMIDLSGAKDVKIEFTGLRDGEKLYEEVLNDSELTKPTIHPKIHVAAVREYPYDLALKNEDELHRISFTFDDMAIVRKMKEIVPEYISKHSKYEVLDKQ